MRKYTLDTDIHLPHVAGETTPLPSAALAAIDPDKRPRRISGLAYVHAAARDFADGNPLQDWLATELKADASFARTPPSGCE